mmetsp:Transcript_12671/g.14872  ORF Transcript_12671/g.14872 Transcript_12671/m.14872 type:complete len:92 (-) Transcript_12671:441-716(-)
MGLTAAFLGGFCGTGFHMTANSIRKIPMSRRPWLHVSYFILGCYSGHYYMNLEQQMVEDINHIRADRGMPPMIGSSKWIRYDTEEEATKAS